MKLLRFLLLLFPVIAWGAIDAPEDGVWGDPSRPGSGFVIETQDNKMAVAAFTYTAAGASTWFLASGTYDSQARRFTGTLTDLANGQCLACPYRAPVGGGNTASIEIRFNNMVDANVLINGQQAYSIKRSYFNFSTPDDLVLGGWAASYYSIGGALSGHALRMEVKEVNGSSTVRGRIDTEQRIALGGYVNSLGKYFILVDSSTSFYTAYVFDGVKDFWFGDAYLYMKTQSITDVSPRTHFAARILNKTTLTRISGAEAKAAADAREEQHWRDFNAAKGLPVDDTREPLPAEIVELAEDFARQMQSQ